MNFVRIMSRNLESEAPYIDSNVGRKGLVLIGNAASRWGRGGRCGFRLTSGRWCGLFIRAGRGEQERGQGLTFSVSPTSEEEEEEESICVVGRSLSSEGIASKRENEGVAALVLSLEEGY